MAFSLVKSELLAATSQLAQQIAQMPGSATERPLDNRRLDYLKGQVTTGQATVFSWAIAVRPDETEVRINGQHSSHLLAALDGDMPKGLMVNLTRYRVEDEHDEILLFKQFDARPSTRSIADIAGAYQCTEADLRAVPRPAAKAAIEGIAFHLRRKVGVRLPKGDEVYGLFHQPEYAPFIVWMGNVLTMKTPELKKAAVVGAIYATWERDPQAAKDFWHEVSRGGQEFAEKAPTTVLDQWLQDADISAKKKRPKVFTDDQLYQGCVFVWNAHRNGKTTIEKVNYNTGKGLSDAE